MGEFIHTADTHLGYRQYHHPDREDDYLVAFSQVIDIAIERDVDAVIHGGDFFHDSRPSTRTIRAALKQLHRLESNRIPFLGVVGNHEGTYDEQWIDIFSELGLATHLSNEPIEIGNTAVYGLDYVPQTKRAQLQYDFQPSGARFNILVMHGLVDPICPFGDWDLTPILGESATAFDAVLLGDDHTPRMERLHDTLVTYPGSTERTAIDQTDPRVCNLIRTVEAKGVGGKQLPLDTRPHVFLDIELKEDEGEDRIREELTTRDLESAIVAITVTGGGGDITPSNIEAYARQEGAFLVRVSDRREFEITEADFDVSFADPDVAVEERLREKGISVPAYEIEKLVRDTTDIPISNLTEEVEARIDTRIAEHPEEFSTEATIDEPPDESNAQSETGLTESDQSTTEEPPATEPEPRSNQISFDEFSE